MIKKVVLASIVLSLLPFTAFAAIGFDASSLGNNASGGATVATTTQTVTTTANTMLVVGIVDYISVPTSVTASGTAMTHLTAADASSTQSGLTSLWYLWGPPTGSVAITANFSGSVNATIISASYTGVANAAPEASSAKNFDTGSNAVFQTALSTLTDNDWTIAEYSNNQFGPITAGASTTLRQAAFGAAGLLPGALLDSNGPITPAGSTNLNSGNTSRFWLGSMMTLQPFIAPANTASPMSFNWIND